MTNSNSESEDLGPESEDSLYPQSEGSYPESEDSYPESEDVYSEDASESPSISVRGRIVPLPRLRLTLSVTAAEHKQSPKDNTTRKEATLKHTSNTKKALKATAISCEPKGEPPAAKKRKGRKRAPKATVISCKPKDKPPAAKKKGKGRTTFNSACAADDLASFVPVSDIVAPSSVNSPPTPSDLPAGPSSSSRTTKKRKLEKMDDDDDDDDSDDGKQWEPVNESYSKKTTSKGMQYRCTLCWKDKIPHYCDREGDMARHLQSLKHAEKQFVCPKSGCSKSYTRKDALKRHLLQKTCGRR